MASCAKTLDVCITYQKQKKDLITLVCQNHEAIFSCLQPGTKPKVECV